MNAAQRLGLRETVITLGVALVLAAVLIGLPPTVLAQSQSNDATLSGLTLSGVDFGTFASGTITYTASVDSGVTETTVTPTPNHSGSSYVIKRDGETDEDGEIALSAGSNVITVEVTAEDGRTTKTYSVTVTRPVSTNAYLRALTLSGIVHATLDGGADALTSGQCPSVMTRHSSSPTPLHPEWCPPLPGLSSTGNCSDPAPEIAGIAG